MMKKVKKIISSLIVNGRVKDFIKELFYNWTAKKNTKYRRSGDIYLTSYNNLTLRTAEPLYMVVPDFDYYQHFYKISAGDIVMDAGANNGYLSVLFSKLVGANGQVHSFEPDHFNIERIKKNISIDSTLSKNIVIYDQLLWDNNTLIDFYEDGSVSSSAVYIPNQSKSVKKEAITIDSWVKRENILKLDFIKMDIEGAEIEALKGCVETIRTLQPNFAIAAYHIVDGQPTYHKVEDFFKQLRYPYKTLTLSKNEIITFAGPALLNHTI